MGMTKNIAALERRYEEVERSMLNYQRRDHAHLLDHEAQTHPSRTKMDLVPSTALLLFAILLLIINTARVSAHGYLKTPRSRNLVACELHILPPFLQLQKKVHLTTTISILYLSVHFMQTKTQIGKIQLMRIPSRKIVSVQPSLFSRHEYLNVNFSAVAYTKNELYASLSFLLLSYLLFPSSHTSCILSFYIYK